VRALLFDVHGNVGALEAVLADARGAGAESFVLGGDYALFGAWPAETVAVLRDLDAVWIRGNGERWTADPAGTPNQELIQRAISDSRERLGDVLVKELAALPSEIRLDGVLVCHASPKSDVETFGPEPGDQDEALLDRCPDRTIVFGHSHLQFSRPAGDRRLVNPGSVGMPLDGDRRSAYALWRDDGSFEARRVEYDWAAYAAELEARLSASLGDAAQTFVRRIEQAAFVA
jgi:predicted phosphodiesterase